MRISDVLREVGRPVAYYPGLVKHLGSVKATVLFCQIFYWQDKASSELGVHKTTDELRDETGLTYEEQRAARTALKRLGVLVETEKRIEHKIYFRIDEDELEQLVSKGSGEVTETPDSRSLPEWEKSISRNGKSPFREMGKAQPAKREMSTPRSGQIPARGLGSSQVVNGVKTTAETTTESSSNTCVHDPVDNPAAAAANSKKFPTPEKVLLTQLAALPRCSIDPLKDRVHVLTWVGRELSAVHLAEAYRRALAARERDRDERPVYAAFLARFVDEVLSGSGPSNALPDETPWYESTSAEVIDARGAELGVRPRKPDEPLGSYRVLVVKASRDKAAVDYVLRDAKKFNSQQLFDFAVATFGDELLPVDFYAS